MNQNIKRTVYEKGTIEQVQFMAKLGGMNPAEKQMFLNFHEGKPDNVIYDEMAMDRKAGSRTEKSMREKLLVAVFECINFTMLNKKN